MSISLPLINAPPLLIRSIPNRILINNIHRLAYRSGVTTAVTAPVHFGFLGGLSTALRTGAVNRLGKGAIIKNIAALHVKLDHDTWVPSISTQIGALRDLLRGFGQGVTREYFLQAAIGEIPLIIETDNADVIATLLDLKREIEEEMESRMRMTIAGGAEAHLLAKELGDAGVGIILTRPRPFPSAWSGKNM